MMCSIYAVHWEVIGPQNEYNGEAFGIVQWKISTEARVQFTGCHRKCIATIFG